MFKLFLILHIVAGTIGLVIGPISMYSKKASGIHTRVGTMYFYLMTLVCLSAAVLAIMHWVQSWWFLLVAIFSFSFAWRGYRAAKTRDKGWIKNHVSGMLGSYIAITTGLLVVNASKIPGYESLPPLLFWLLPTIIGVPFIAKVTKKYAH